MKKAVRILGLALVLGMVLGSCSKDDDTDNGPVVVDKNHLIGKYKITGAQVATPVDINGDGVKNNDLIKEGYNVCSYDNTIEITEKNLNYIMQGKACDASETNQTNTYVISEDKKSITVFKDGTLFETLSNIELDKNSAGKSELFFNKFDETLQQKVYFVLEKL